MRFHTESGAVYLYDGESLTRLAEFPPHTYGAPWTGAPRAAREVTATEVGRPARFEFQDGTPLRTSPVTKIVWDLRGEDRHEDAATERAGLRLVKS